MCCPQVRCALTQLPPDLSGLAQIQLLDLRGNESLVAHGGVLQTASLAQLEACRTLDLRMGFEGCDPLWCGALCCCTNCCESESATVSWPYV